MPNSRTLADPEGMTVSQFIDWAAGQSGSWCLINGVPQAMAPGGRRHGTLQAELIGRLVEHLRQARPSCSVVAEPGVIPWLSAHDNYRMPDLAVTCSPEIEESWSVDQPILVVEILSPSNRAQTWMNVWSYTTIPSVEDILVVHTDDVRAALLRRNPDMTWPSEADIIGTNGRLRLASVDYEAALLDLYRNNRLGSAGQTS